MKNVIVDYYGSIANLREKMIDVATAMAVDSLETERAVKSDQIFLLQSLVNMMEFVYVLKEVVAREENDKNRENAPRERGTRRVTGEETQRVTEHLP